MTERGFPRRRTAGTPAHDRKSNRFGTGFNERAGPSPCEEIFLSLSARRYRGEGATQRYVALFSSPEVPSSRPWKEAAGTPWTERLRPHFRDHLRIECTRYRRNA